MRRYVRYGEAFEPWPYAQFMRPDNEIRRELGCSYFRWELGTLIQIRTFIDDFYVELEGIGTLRNWAERTLPAGAGVL